MTVLCRHNRSADSASTAILALLHISNYYLNYFYSHVISLVGSKKKTSPRYVEKYICDLILKTQFCSMYSYSQYF